MGAQPPGLRLSCTNVDPARPRPRLVVGGDRRRRRAGPRPGRRGRAAGRRRGAVPARGAARGPPRQRRAGVLRRLHDLRARRGRRVLLGRLAGRPAGARRSCSCRRHRSRPRSPAGCSRPRCRTPTPRPTPGARRCSSPRWRASPSTCCARTRDYLHQEYRRPAMPDSLALVDRLRADGVPALVSGAGPTVLAFTDAAGAAGAAGAVPGRLGGSPARGRDRGRDRSPDAVYLDGAPSSSAWHRRP